jgi:glutamine synthetase
MLNAALLGVVDGLDCGEPQRGDGDTEPNTDRHTPHTLADALAAFEADSVLCEAMGPDLVRAYLAIRRDEVRRWEESGNEWSVESITDWELTQYLPFF